MAIRLYVLGKTKEDFFQQSEAEYLKRLQRYTKLEYITLPASKHETQAEKCLEQEGQTLLQKLRPTDFVILLDEHGKHYGSESFSEQLQSWMMHQSQLVFVIGGAFGFSQEVKQRANAKWSLSKLTFPHHLVRTIFLEQLYRAFTLLKGGKYHNK